jgi:hypothetical protein
MIDVVSQCSFSLGEWVPFTAPLFSLAPTVIPDKPDKPGRTLFAIGCAVRAGHTSSGPPHRPLENLKQGLLAHPLGPRDAPAALAGIGANTAPSFPMIACANVVNLLLAHAKQEARSDGASA